MCEHCNCGAQNVQTFVLPVKGLDCASSAEKIAIALSHLEGISNVKASVEECTIAFDIGTSGHLAEVKAVINAAGMAL